MMTDKLPNLKLYDINKQRFLSSTTLVRECIHANPRIIIQAIMQRGEAREKNPLQVDPIIKDYCHFVNKIGEKMFQRVKPSFVFSLACSAYPAYCIIVPTAFVRLLAAERRHF